MNVLRIIFIFIRLVMLAGSLIVCFDDEAKRTRDIALTSALGWFCAIIYAVAS